jgi:hypothetical protein
MTEDDRVRELLGLLARSRRAMLWAIAERKVEKAGEHATKAARFARLLQQRQEKLGG